MIAGENPIISKAVVRVKSGDADAFRLIIREYKSPAYSLAFRILRHAEEAEETVQDAFLKAYQKIHQFKGDSKFSSWFLKIVYNLSLTKTRKKRIHIVEINEDLDFNFKNQKIDGDSWNMIMQDEREMYVRQAIDKLPGDDALVLTMFYMSDQSVPEICKITGWTQSSAKVKLHRARHKLYGSLFSILKFEMKELI
jgi:RNA polymerase sigma-70 factor (ECF subfamily)